MHDGSTRLGGLEIPSVDPIFLTIVAIHVVIGLTAVVSGAMAMLSVKEPGRHPSAGRVYFWSLAALAVTATALAAARWAEDYHLFILGALALFAAFFGRKARRQRWPGWARYHIVGMGLSYILMLTAFYVDNGKSLPLWNRLPPVSYWFIPAAIGVPLIVRALLTNPLAQRSSGQR
ncbi:MAG TPA: hypothetical protein VKB34_21620 [Povalibacter sp.]|nr:hypothetical protein [Povalibacter sp.]